MARRELNYMGIDKEGRFVCVTTANNPDTARTVGKWIRQGLSVERCDDNFVHEHFGDIIRKPKVEGVNARS